MKHTAEVMKFSNQSAQASKGISLGERLVFADVLNIVCALAVVMLHTSLNVYTPEHTSIWSFSVKLQATCVFAVPVFFMIRGMNLLGYREKYSTKVFFLKRACRVGFTLLLGSVLCYCLFCFYPQSFWGSESFAGAFGLNDFKAFLDKYDQ